MGARRVYARWFETVQVRTMSTESDDVQKAPPIVVPTTFGAEVTVPAGGTAELTFTVDQDTLINGVEIHAERPTIVRISAGGRPGPQTPTVGHAQSFGEYLERELPALGELRQHRQAPVQGDARPHQRVELAGEDEQVLAPDPLATSARLLRRDR